MIGFEPFCRGGKPASSRSVAAWLPVPGSSTLLFVSAPTLPTISVTPIASDDPERDHDHRVGGHEPPEPVEQPCH